MLKKILTIIVLTIAFLSKIIFVVIADTEAINHGLNYLKVNQDSTGKITGFGGESQWAAIAFSANGIDVSTVKNYDVSLKEYLLSDQPAESAAATEWERRILTIIAIGEDPSNFGGINYIENLEAWHTDNQLGEVSLLNDDIFGILALVASGPLADQTIIQDSISFIIDHQAEDGGFSWSTETCEWCGSDSNDTAATIQALQLARENGFSHPGLEVAIDGAKEYLLSTQKDGGGFAYDAFSEADGSSTAWALMALNSLGQTNSTEAQEANNWLFGIQESDGGFPWMAGFGSDTSTTSHALIALSGKSWILHIFNSEEIPSPLPSPSSTSTITPSPSPTATPEPITTPTSTSIPTPSPSPTPTPTLTPVITNVTLKNTQSPQPSPEILGVSTDEEAKENETLESLSDGEKTPQKNGNGSLKRGIILSLASLGVIIVLIVGLKIWENGKEK